MMENQQQYLTIFEGMQFGNFISKDEQILQKIQNADMKSRNINPSEFINQYKNYISNNKIDKKQIQTSFAFHGIKYRPYQYQSFQYCITETFLNYHIIKLHVKIVHYQLDLYVLNESISNPLAQYNKIQGNYGEIYLIRYFNQEIAVKSIKIRPNQVFLEIFGNIVKELSIMKICSIIGCSLKSQRYLGFDLIVYSDCIQFSMPKGGREQEYIKQKTMISNNLKQQLALMHSFNIVHCDIKPQNMILCPTQNKYVFIDFGLAEVIKDDLGFKSLTRFKGTPQLTSPEMFSIISSDNEHYIDLYFNDVWGLKGSIDHISIQIYNEEEDCEYHQKQLQQISDITLSIFLTYALKFHYLSNNISIINDILNYNNCFLIKKSNKQLLTFIKGIYPIKFIPYVFYNYFNCYEITDQYKSIEKLRKVSQNTISYLQISTQQKQSNNQFFKRYLKIALHRKSLNIKSANFQLIFCYFMRCTNKRGKLPTFNSLEDMFGIMLQCLRFDKVNLKFEKKLQLSVLFKQLIGSSKQILHKQSIQDIKIVFKAMVNYLLKPQLTKWKLDKGFDIFSQLIILDVNINQDLFSYITQAKNKCLQTEDKFILAVKMNNLNFLIQMKSITSANRYLHLLQTFLIDQVKIILSQVTQRSKNQSKNLLYVLSKIVLKYNHQWKITQCFLSKIEEIQNIKFKRLIKQILNTNKIYSCVCGSYDENTFLNLKSILQQQYQNHNLIKLFAYISQFLSSMLCFQQVKQLNNSVKSMLDNQKIYQSFRFQYCCFLYDSQDNNSQSLLKYVYQFKQNYTKMKDLNVLNVNVLNGLYYLIRKIKNNIEFQKQHKQVIKEIYIKFILENCFHQFSLLSVFLEIEFMGILPKQLDQYFVSRLECLKQKCPPKEQINLNKLCLQNKFAYLKLKYHYNLTKNPEKTLQCHPHLLKQVFQLYDLTCLLFDQFISISHNFQCILKLLIDTSTIQLTQEYIDKVTSILQRQSGFGYFLKPTKYLILKQIFNFYLKNKCVDKIYQFSQMLICWFSKNPFQKYFDVLMKTLKHLFWRDKQIFRYSNLQCYIQNFRQKLKNNPCYVLYLIYSADQEEVSMKMKMKILKLIALYINHLTTYPRKDLLVYYYTIMINILAIPRRKRVYLIKFLRDVEIKKIKQFMTLETSTLIKMVNNSKINNKKTCYKKLKMAFKSLNI